MAAAITRCLRRSVEAVSLRKKGHWKSAEVLHNSMENPDCAGSMSVLPESGRSEAAESGITRMSACIECEEQDLEKPDPGASFFQKIGWKQSSCEWKNLEYQPKHMMSEKWKTFVMGTRLEKAS